MRKEIEVTIKDGNIAVEAKNFAGADCLKATKFIEDALGNVAERTKKPEFNQRQVNAAQARVSR